MSRPEVSSFEKRGPVADPATSADGKRRTSNIMPYKQSQLLNCGLRIRDRVGPGRFPAACRPEPAQAHCAKQTQFPVAPRDKAPGAWDVGRARTNKANWGRVSSSRFQVSSEPSRTAGLPGTSNFTLQTAAGNRAKQTQFW